MSHSTWVEKTKSEPVRHTWAHALKDLETNTHSLSPQPHAKAVSFNNDSADGAASSACLYYCYWTDAFKRAFYSQLCSYLTGLNA